MPTFITEDVLANIDYVRMMERPLRNAKKSTRNLEMMAPIFRRRSELLYEAGFATLERLAHFLAQTAFESNGYQRLSENLKYTLNGFRNPSNVHLRRPFNNDEREFAKFVGDEEGIANRIYSKKFKPRLGNGDEASGDGYRYRGRGILQITGKDNYDKYGKMIGIDLVSSPDLLIEDLDVSVAVAAAYFQDRGIHALADQNNCPAVTKEINGAHHGLPVRAAITEGILANLKGAYTPAGAESSVQENPPEGLRLNDTGPEVRRLQEMLNDLGFPVGVVDETFGKKTYTMLVAFQATYGLQPHGVATREVFTTLHDAVNARPIEDEPNERADRTEKKMRDAGIKEPQDAAAVSTGSVVVGGAAAAGVAQEAGIIDKATDALKPGGEGAGPDSVAAAGDAIMAKAADPSLLMVGALLVVIFVSMWIYSRSRRIKSSSVKAFQEGRYLR
ncbi:MAG: peptidoglycan-binding protein [Pseudomonadota bacterium]